MMKYSDFEKQMAKKLRIEEVDLDTTAFYKQLTKPAKKRKGAFIYWLSFLLLGCLSAGTYLYVNNGIVKADPYSFVPDNKIMDSTEEIPSLYLANESESKSTTVHQISTDHQIEHTDSKNASTSNSLNSASENSFNIVNTSSNDITSISTKVPVQTDNDYSISESTQSTSPIGTNYDPASSEELKRPEQSIAQNESQTSIITKEELPQTNDEYSNSGQVISLNEEKFELDGAKAKSLLSTSSVPSLMLLPDNESTVYKLDTKIECPDFRINKKRFDIEALAEVGYFRPMKSFSNNGVDSNEVDMLRIDHETTKEGYHAAAYLKFIGRKVPFYLQVGIAQDYLTERMELDYSYIERDTTQGIISITTSEDGDTITAIIGDIVTETEVSGRQRKHYRLQTIDLPLMAGYEFNFDRFSLGIEGGVIFNLRMRSTGKILSAATDFEKVDVSQPFRTNVGMSYMGGLSLGFYLTPRSRLYLNTKMRFLPSEFNSSSNSLSQKYKFLGINVGYGYIF